MTQLNASATAPAAIDLAPDRTKTSRPPKDRQRAVPPSRCLTFTSQPEKCGKNGATFPMMGGAALPHGEQHEDAPHPGSDKHQRWSTTTSPLSPRRQRNSRSL